VELKRTLAVQGLKLIWAALAVVIKSALRVRLAVAALKL
jgi:hypothetical protein